MYLRSVIRIMYLGSVTRYDTSEDSACNKSNNVWEHGVVGGGGGGYWRAACSALRPPLPGEYLACAAAGGALCSPARTQTSSRPYVRTAAPLLPHSPIDERPEPIGRRRLSRPTMAQRGCGDQVAGREGHDGRTFLTVPRQRGRLCVSGGWSKGYSRRGAPKRRAGPAKHARPQPHAHRPLPSHVVTAPGGSSRH